MRPMAMGIQLALHYQPDSVSRWRVAGGGITKQQLGAGRSGVRRSLKAMMVQVRYLFGNGDTTGWKRTRGANMYWIRDYIRVNGWIL